MPTLSPTPPYMLSGFQGHPDTLRAMARAVHGPRGEQSMLVRSMTEEVVRHVQPKDYLGEIVAVNNWVADHVRYTNDALHVEIVKDPQRMIEEILEHGVALEDCDGYATLITCMCLQLGRVSEFVVVGFNEPGQYSHVFGRVQEPRSAQFIVTDPVAGTDVRGMLDRVTTFYTKSLDEPA